MYQLADAAVCARHAATRGLRVREPLGIAEWTAKYRVLSKKEASEYGPFDNDRIPYLRGIMEALGDDHPAEIVVFAKSAQTGGTTVGQNWLGWTLHQSPANMMILMPSEKMSLRWVRSKLNPMIAECAVLRAILPPGRRGKNDDTMLEKHYPGGVLYVGSANIPSDLAMVACQRVLLDEVDRFPRALDKEGDPVELVKNRMKTFAGRRKMFLISTPTDESSRIDADYRLSSMGRYYVPCPDCGAMQPLRWGNLTWPEGKPEQAMYRCEECATLIDEHFKTQMLAGGSWVHEKPEFCTSMIGFHVHCLYTPLGLGQTWGENAREYERAKRDPAKLQVFENTKLGQVHRGERIQLHGEDVAKRREPYRLRTIPPGVLLLTCGVDVQHDRLEAQVLGWSPDERLTVIDYQILPGDPYGTEVWQRLDSFLAGEILNAFGVPMRISCTLVDAGFAQHEVINFTRGLRQRNVFAAKSANTVGRQAIGRPSLVEVKYRGKTDKRGAELYILGPHVLKNTLFARLRADEVALPAERHIRFSEDLSDEYFEQLTAEIFDPAKGRWGQIRDRNEALDTMIYGMAAAMHHSVQVHRLRELDWQRLEQLYQPSHAVKVVEPQLGKTPLDRLGGFLPTAAPRIKFGD